MSRIPGGAVDNLGRPVAIPVTERRHRGFGGIAEDAGIDLVETVGRGIAELPAMGLVTGTGISVERDEDASRVGPRASIDGSRGQVARGRTSVGAALRADVRR